MTTTDKTIPLPDRLRESAQHWVNEIDTRVEAACAIELLQMRIAELEAAQPAIARAALETAAKLCDGIGNVNPPMSFGVLCATAIRAIDPSTIAPLPPEPQEQTK